MIYVNYKQSINQNQKLRHSPLTLSLILLITLLGEGEVFLASLRDGDLFLAGDFLEGDFARGAAGSFSTFSFLPLDPERAFFFGLPGEAP